MKILHPTLFSLAKNNLLVYGEDVWVDAGGLGVLAFGEVAPGGS